MRRLRTARDSKNGGTGRHSVDLRLVAAWSHRPARDKTIASYCKDNPMLEGTDFEHGT
ncbi:MAG TPA: hypothetical protein VHB79_10310 [Polyangiaceae bacterium]|nr:hypothetical protein [Polyangiaceae bacterium]